MDAAAARSIREAFESDGRVTGLSHTFYRYPARFSPEFVRAVIKATTRPGDVVMDPFMGGGTTAVESLSLGRRFIGADINPLARFISDAKTTPLSEGDVSILSHWAITSYELSIRDPAGHVPSRWRGYLRQVPWWLRQRIQCLLTSADALPSPRLRRFARCSVLRTAQWALDNRRTIATSGEFSRAHWIQLQEMLRAGAIWSRKLDPVGISHLSQLRKLLARSASGIEKDRRIPESWKPIKLVLTSPPYPGVHVLYHRWQVQGRRETAAPFWIAGHEDGHPASFYTMGPRYASDLGAYLVELEAAFRSIVSLLGPESLIVQLVGFSDPEVQLGPVLDTLESVGLLEIGLSRECGSVERSWRRVPNRKWYAGSHRTAGSARELLLLHQPVE